MKTIKIYIDLCLASEKRTGAGPIVNPWEQFCSGQLFGMTSSEGFIYKKNGKQFWGKPWPQMMTSSLLQSAKI